MRTICKLDFLVLLGHFHTFAAKKRNVHLYMDLQLVKNLSERCLNGESLSEDEVTMVVLCIIACVLALATFAILILIVCLFPLRMYVGWLIEDIWEWAKSITRSNVSRKKIGNGT